MIIVQFLCDVISSVDYQKPKKFPKIFLLIFRIKINWRDQCEEKSLAKLQISLLNS